jgi:ABC-2 type transport system permease protein
MTATLATGVRVLRQLRHDHRTVGLMLLMPIVVVTLLWWLYDGNATFDVAGVLVLGLFPLIINFIVTAVATLRERTSGTLERLSTLPLGRLDFLLGYALGFGLLATVQTLLVSSFTLGLLDLQVAGSPVLLGAIALLNALLGMSMGLFVSAFANNEFQAVQFFPALVIPQLLLCGLLLPREEMPDALYALSSLLPLSYGMDALRAIQFGADTFSEVSSEFLIVGGFVVGFLLLGAATLRRQTD